MAPTSTPTADRLDRSLLAAAAVHVLLVLSTAQALLTVLPPFVDLPLHASTIALLRDPALRGEDYVDQLRPWSTNSLWFTLDRHLLSAWLTPVQSVQLGSALAVALVPTGLAVWARGLRRSPAVALLLGWWFAWTRPLYWGFLNYTLACGIGLATLGVDAWLSRDDRPPTPARQAVLATLLVLTFITHAQVFAFVVGGIGLQRLLLSPNPRQALRHLVLPMLPVAGLFTLWLWTIASPAGPSSAPFVVPGEDLHATWHPRHINWAFTVINAGGPLKDTLWDDRLVKTLLVLAGLAAGLAAWRGQFVRRSVPWVLLGMAAAAMTIYVLGPAHIRGQFYVSMRMAWWVLPPLAIATTPRLHSRWRHPAWSVALVGAILAQGLHLRAMRLADEEAADLRDLIAEAPPGRQLAVWVHRRSSAVVHGNTYQHAAGWYAAERAGTTHYGFASMRPNPVVYADRTAFPRVREGEEKKPWCAAMAGRGGKVELVMTRQDRRRGALCGATEHYRDALQPLARHGEWALYEVTKPLTRAPKKVRRQCHCRDR